MDHSRSFHVQDRGQRFRGGGGFMSEIGTIWQLGVLNKEGRTFFAAKWVIFGISALQNKERVLRALEVK